MARVSRKAVIAASFEQDVFAVRTPPLERIYSTGIYVRLSVEGNNRQDDSDSIEMQIYMLRKYVKEQPDLREYRVYRDNGRTGVNFSRPEFEKLIDDIQAGKIDCVIVKDLSRFGRNYIETGHYIEKIFHFLDVRFIAVNDGFDSKDGNSSDAMTVNLKNLINDFYAKDISKKTGTALAIKQKNGEFIGAFAPYGYLKSERDNHKLLIDEKAAPVVRQIFLWKAEGMGNNQIARKLNEAGVVSPALYLYRSGLKKTKPTGMGAVWQGQIIKRITENITYTGSLAQGKSKKSLHDGIPTTLIPQSEWIIVSDTHKPIIDMRTFQKVQEIKRAVREERLCLNGKHAAMYTEKY